jgi:hypothetical protein
LGDNERKFVRWRERIERGLTRLAGGAKVAGAGRYAEALEHSRSLGKLNAPVARLFNGLGELSLKAGFALLAIVLLRRAEEIDPADPLLKLNSSRARMSLATRFLLRSPSSGGAAYNLSDGKARLEALISGGSLPEIRQAEAVLLLRRIEDRLEMWRDLKAGKLEEAKVRELIADDDRLVRDLRARKIPSVEELDKLEPGRTGFYYREYREQQRRQKSKRR